MDCGSGTAAVGKQIHPEPGLTIEERWQRCQAQPCPSRPRAGRSLPRSGWCQPPAGADGVNQWGWAPAPALAAPRLAAPRRPCPPRRNLAPRPRSQSEGSRPRLGAHRRDCIPQKHPWAMAGPCHGRIQPSLGVPPSRPRSGRGDEGPAGARLSLPPARQEPGWHGTGDGCSMCRPPPAHLRAAAGSWRRRAATCRGARREPRAEGEQTGRLQLLPNEHPSLPACDLAQTSQCPPERQSCSLRGGAFVPLKKGVVKGGASVPGQGLFLTFEPRWLPAALPGSQTLGAGALQGPAWLLRGASTLASPPHTPGWSRI